MCLCWEAGKINYSLQGFNHNCEEFDATFFITDTIQFKLGQITINMVILKFKIWVIQELFQNRYFTANFMICPAGNTDDCSDVKLILIKVLLK